jgi:hypothetical protein
MKINRLTNQSSNETLFETYVIEDYHSFEELLQTYHQFKQQHTGKSILLTLDDLGQAEYTSTHATMSHDLDDTEGYDLSNLDAAAFENGEHIGYLSTPSEFFIRKENFLKKVADVDFADACDRDLTIEPAEIELLKKINQAPIAYFDQQILVKIIPVTQSYEAICGFPNGYFTSDLNPFENYAVAKHLQQQYGYELFGIGASCIGFIRSSILDEASAKELTIDLMKLYHAPESTFQPLFELVRKQAHLILKYVETIE